MPRKTKIISTDEIINNARSIKDFVNASCAIYFLTTKGEITYVGQTITGIRRIWEHFDKTVFNSTEKLFDGFFIQPCRREELDELETEYILKLNPRYNATVPSIKKYASLDIYCKQYRLTKSSIKELINKHSLPFYEFKNRIYVKRETLDAVVKNMNELFLISRKGRRITNITDHTYGDLKVLIFSHQDEKGHAYWICLCKCGRKITVPAYKLKSYSIQSCGIPHDTTNERLGKWALHPVEIDM